VLRGADGAALGVLRVAEGTALGVLRGTDGAALGVLRGALGWLGRASDSLGTRAGRCTSG
jgi:hypothetical protein